MLKLSNFNNVLNIFKSIHSYNRLLYKYSFSMDKAYLRHLNGSDQFQFTFKFTKPELRVDRQFNFCRPLAEDINTFLGRVSANVAKVISKKTKKKKDQNVDNSIAPVNVKLSLNGSEVNGDMLCKNIFQSDTKANIVLKVLENEYSIIVNSPWIDNITLPSSLLANFPVYPSKFETLFTDKHLSSFTWYKSSDKSDWVEIGNGFVFMPKNEHIGCYLKVNCVPKNCTLVGPGIEIVSDVTVQASPGFCPFETRHLFTKQRACGKRFRVVTYNILADLYCDSEFSRTSLYPYCPPYALNIDYRKQLIIKEIIGYNADVICLQELDKKVYNNDLEPVFDSLQYNSVFKLKGGLVAEGLACFYNNNRFKLLESNTIILGEELTKSSLFADIWEKVSQNEKLAERVTQRTTTVQVTCLESTEFNEILVVANTHLYFHPDADHIRLLQAGLAIRFVMDTIEKLKSKTNHGISLVFCGDFNSVPECGVYKLYITGNVPETCIDWESNKEEAVRNLSLNQPFQLQSACGTPQFTNYTAGFAGCLDYIFYDKSRLEVEQVIPLPSNEELMEHVALPSVVFPSDHISLVADLKWL